MQTQQIADVVVTVDSVLLRMTPTGLEVLLIKRRNSPFQNKWALPGGRLNANDPSLEQALLREVLEETGLTLQAKQLRQIRSYGNVGRDPRGRAVSVLYTLTEFLPENTQARAGDDALAVRWCAPISEATATLAFDHRAMIEDAIQSLYDQRGCSSPGTRQLHKPEQCEVGSEFGERCPLPARWQVNGWAMCDEDIRFLADMNSDNEELVRPALAAIQAQESEAAR